MEKNQLLYLNALNCIPNIGPATLYKILVYFDGDFKSAWHAPINQLNEAGIAQSQCTALIKNKIRIEPEDELEKVEKENIQICSIVDKNYPALLKEIATPPILLYIRGSLQNDDIFFSVIGTRRPSLYGKRVAHELTSQLAFHGLTIVSGLARGIDSIAHRSVIEHNMKTVAVVASGLDKGSLYPPENWDLVQEITQKNGAIISEFPLGMNASKEKFPQRNRIISGIAHGVLIVEAAKRSGALITARYALEQNRDVFAVPGEIYSPLSAGTNHLIQEGSKPVLDVQDILCELNIEYVYNKKEIVPKDETEKAILHILSEKPTSIDEIIRLSQIGAQKVNAAIIQMEMENKIRGLGGDTYTLNI